MKWHFSVAEALDLVFNPLEEEESEEEAELEEEDDTVTDPD